MLGDGIYFILHGQKMDDRRWNDLMQQRWLLVEPLLDRYQLPKLGEQEQLRVSTQHGRLLLDEGTFWGSRPAAEDNPAFTTRDYSMDTRGMFVFQSVPSRGENYYSHWGLTRKGKWIEIELHFVTNQTGERTWAQKATEVSVVELELKELAEKRSAEKVCRLLNMVVNYWVRNQQHLWNVSEEFDRENKLLRTMGG